MTTDRAGYQLRPGTYVSTPDGRGWVVSIRGGMVSGENILITVRLPGKLDRYDAEYPIMVVFTIRGMKEEMLRMAGTLQRLKERARKETRGKATERMAKALDAVNDVTECTDRWKDKEMPKKW